MSNDMEAALQKLVNTVAQNKSVRAIGLCGSEQPLPEPGEADLDLFVYCTDVPANDERQELPIALQGEIEQVEIGKLEGGHWGQGDCFLLAGVETWLLYFTVAEAQAELEAILNGQYLGRLDSYYFPIGRLAMWKTMRLLYDPDDFLQGTQQCLDEYPDGLAAAVLHHHLKALEDVEDLERAVGRKDVFFFHFALDLALDHFLQALFALNREYFPSRKRSERYLRGFKIKPEECERRLRQVVSLGGNAETLGKSCQVWNRLTGELKLLTEGHRIQGKT